MLLNPSWVKKFFRVSLAKVVLKAVGKHDSPCPKFVFEKKLAIICGGRRGEHLSSIRCCLLVKFELTDAHFLAIPGLSMSL